MARIIVSIAFDFVYCLFDFDVFYEITFSLHSILEAPLPSELEEIRMRKTYPYFSFNSFINGSLILEFIGARIPFSEIVPLSTCLTAIGRMMLVTPPSRSKWG